MSSIDQLFVSHEKVFTMKWILNVKKSKSVEAELAHLIGQNFISESTHVTLKMRKMHVMDFVRNHFGLQVCLRAFCLS